MAELIRRKFEPQPNITAFELAFILLHIHGASLRTILFDPDKWAALDETIKRHFVDDAEPRQ